MQFNVLSSNTAYIVAFSFCALLYGDISNIVKTIIYV